MRAAAQAPAVWQNGRMTSHLLRRLRLALILGLAVVTSACGSTVSSADQTLRASAAQSGSGSLPSAGSSPNSSDLATYARIEAQVEAIRELRSTTPVTPVLLDSKGMSDWLTKANAEGTDHGALANESRLFIHLGLLPAGSSLEQMELDLLVGQVVGLYDTVTKSLYVLSESGGVGPVEKVTFAHEFTHALQDQNFGLDKLATDTPDQGDRDLARTALPEGDATLSMMQWMLKDLSAAEIAAVAGDSSSAAQAKQLDSAPAILRGTLLFPYEQGLAFVQGIYAKGGWAAVDRIYASPPDSTSQILHPELYAAGVRPVPVSVPIVFASLGSGWKLTMQDTLGELQLRIWLEGEKPSTAATATAASATSAWGGDRVGLYEGPNGAWAVVLQTSWRTAEGRAAFRNAATSKSGQLPGPAVVCASGNDVAFYVASDVAALEAFASCRPPL
jgi:hypothetical protein